LRVGGLGNLFGLGQSQGLANFAFVIFVKSKDEKPKTENRLLTFALFLSYYQLILNG
jgi:hypothetical protein